MGAYLEPPPGFIPEDEYEKLNAAQAAPATAPPPPGFVPEDEVSGTPPGITGELIQGPRDSGFHNFTRKVAKGFTLGLGDVAAAAGGATGGALVNWVKGKPAAWQKEYNKARGEDMSASEAYERESPGMALTGELVGATASIPGAGAKYIAKGADLGSRMARQALVGGGVGAAYGAGSTPGGVAERAKGAAAGGGTGFALAPAASLGVAGVQKIIKTGARLLPNSAQRTAALEVAQALWRDEITVPQAMVRLRQMGAESIIADLGENNRRLAGSALRSPGRTATEGTQILERRQRLQHRRMGDLVRKQMGTKGGYHQTVTDLIDARQTAARPAYDAAYNAEWKATATTSPDDLVEIINSPAARSVWADARKLAQNDVTSGRLPKDYRFPVAGKDEVMIADTRAADYIKKALDDQITSLYKSGKTTKAGSYAGVRDNLKDVADELNPLYKKARDAFAGPSESIDALKKGRDFLKEDSFYTARDIDKMSPSNRRFFREGVSQKVQEILKGKKEGADKAADFLRVPGMREKMAATFENVEDYRGWLRGLLGEEKMNKTFRELGGSQTAGRQVTEGARINKANFIRDLVWMANGNVFAKMRMFGHGVRAGGLKGPSRESVAEALRPIFSKSPSDQAALFSAAQTMGPAAGIMSAVPELAGQLAASQSYKEGPQQSVVAPLLLWEELNRMMAADKLR